MHMLKTVDDLFDGHFRAFVDHAKAFDSMCRGAGGGAGPALSSGRIWKCNTRAPRRLRLYRPLQR